MKRGVYPSKSAALRILRHCGFVNLKLKDFFFTYRKGGQSRIYFPKGTVCSGFEHDTWYYASLVKYCQDEGLFQLMLDEYDGCGCVTPGHEINCVVKDEKTKVSTLWSHYVR